MAHTPLLHRLVRLAQQHAVAREVGRPVEALREEGALRALRRRDVLAGASALAAAAMFAPRSARAAGGPQPRIAIIGGGIAGLSTALTLADAGYTSTIYEALPNRVGGRMLSERSGPGGAACGSCHTVNGNVADSWVDGQVTDVFGELIDSNHATIRGLASRFNLPLTDLLAAQPAGTEDTNYFLGRHYTMAEVEADFVVVKDRLGQDLRSAGYPTTWNSSRPGGRALDNMSLRDWIESRVPGGLNSRMGRLIEAAYVIEFGADSTDQSALNMIYMLGYAKGGWQVFGPSDERYRLTGGIDRLTDAVAREISPNAEINIGWFMTRLGRRSDGAYSLDFDVKGGGTRNVVADLVVLAAPFAALRNIDLAGAGFDALKMKAINELGAGHNGKLHLQFDTRYWNGPGVWGRGNGSGFSDTGFQAMWESTRGQAGVSGILVGYNGGSVTDAQSLKHPYGNITKAGVSQDAQRFLAQLEPVFPGISARWNGRATNSMPHLNPFWNSSYCYWKVGQYQTIAGYERVRQANVFFAGEHTSLDFQGFMEGGASEGVRAGKEIVASLRGK